MQTTKEDIHKIHELTTQIADAKAVASELKRTAVDQYGEEKEKVTRDGKEVEVTRNMLWQEVMILGAGCEAATTLKKYHQDVFDAYHKQNEIAAELKEHIGRTFGFDYTQMTVSDYIKLTDAIFELKLAEHNS